MAKKKKGQRYTPLKIFGYFILFAALLTAIFPDRRWGTFGAVYLLLAAAGVFLADYIVLKLIPNRKNAAVLEVMLVAVFLILNWARR